MHRLKERWYRGAHLSVFFGRSFFFCDLKDIFCGHRISGCSKNVKIYFLSVTKQKYSASEMAGWAADTTMHYLGLCHQMRRKHWFCALISPSGTTYTDFQAMGLRVEPWGTPQVTSILDDTNSPRDSTHFLPVRDGFSQFKTEPDMLRWSGACFHGAQSLKWLERKQLLCETFKTCTW